MMVMVGKGDCPKCKSLKNKLEEMGNGCVYLDGQSLKNGEYGVPSTRNDPRLDAIVALLFSNLQVPVLIVDGVQQNVEEWLKSVGKCENGVCKVA